MKKNIKFTFLFIVLVCLVLPLAWLLFVRFEGHLAQVSIIPGQPIIGSTTELAIQARDEDCGLRSIRVGILKDGKEVVLAEKEFPAGGLLEGGVTKSERMAFTVEPEKLGLSDGEGILRISVRDYSWRKWLRGNLTYSEIPVRIDTRPPDIDVLSRNHYLAQGGTGVVVYKVSEECPKTGVFVGDHFFPGYAGITEDPNVRMAFFAVAYDQPTNTRLHIEAVDRAGNRKEAGFSYLINPRKFRDDRLSITDGFLEWKMPEFKADIGAAANGTTLDQFLAVNGELRKKNYLSVKKACSSSDPQLYWEGAFARLPNAANRARYADKRTYMYGGKVVDHQVHMGIDLASVAHSPVPAANNGRVAFTGSIGIYGKTVIIDHGFGLFSMYAHLSAIDTEPERKVAKNEIIGRTGRTGLAGGDHLHFSVIVNDTFVNPVEWWDPQWIQNNITDKINAVTSEN